MHFESGYESFKKWGGGIFVFEKQEKGSNAKKKKKIISQQ